VFDTGPALCIVVFVWHRAGPVYSRFCELWHRAGPVYRHFDIFTYLFFITPKQKSGFCIQSAI